MFWEKIFGGAEESRAPRKSYLAYDASKTETDRISAEQLSAIAASVEEHLRAVEGLMQKSGDDAARFSTSLEEGSALLADPDKTAESLSRLVNLTREMVEKTRKVEEELRARTEAVGLLQGNLQQEKARAETDQLTGLTNRRAFERELGSAAERARIYNTPLAIAFCDIDNFKVINDIHGPATGDRVLTFIGTVLDLTEQARQELAERRIVDRQTGRPVGHVNFSAGVAAIGPDYDIGVMLSKADQALYKAKQAGRGTVRMTG